MIHDLTLKLLGTLPDSAVWCYGILDLLLSLLFIFILISPFIILFKLIGGK